MSHPRLWLGHLGTLNIVNLLLYLPSLFVHLPRIVVKVLALLNDGVPSSKARASVDGLSIGEIGHSKLNPGSCVFGSQRSWPSL